MGRFYRSQRDEGLAYLAVGTPWAKAQKWDRCWMCGYLLDWSGSLRLGMGVSMVDKVEGQAEGSSQRACVAEQRTQGPLHIKSKRDSYVLLCER